MSRLMHALVAALAVAVLWVMGTATPASADGSSTCGTGDLPAPGASGCLDSNGNPRVGALTGSDNVSPGRSGTKGTGGGAGGSAPVRVCDQLTIGGATVCQCLVDGVPESPYIGACGARSAGSSASEVEGAVRRAVATLRLPEGMPQLAPDPWANEWRMAVVGFPLWLTTDAPKSASVSVVREGIAIRITATRGKTVFDMGEPGVQPVSCWHFAVRPQPASPHDAPSPDCGYVYQHHGVYTVSAATSWRVDWSAAGFSGSLQVERTARLAEALTVGELVSVIVPNDP